MSRFSKQIPQEFTVRGNELKCPVCGNTRFRTRQAMLNTFWATLFDLDWVNRNADCYVCSECTHIMWFFGD